MMEKIYNPQNIEQSLYYFWEKNGYFKPNNNLEKPSFCIMIPPPNVTGNLHMGHAFQQTLMDILIRYNRMQGKNTLWQVGTDHAGIATQILVEKKIKLEEKKTKQDYNRKDFIKKIWLWKNTSCNMIVNQMRRLGNSVDWDREKFTLDSDISLAVTEAFISLYKHNLIYQKKRLVHWDPKIETVISDLEVEHRSIRGKQWFIRYPIVYNQKFKNNTLKYLVVVTTRPETLLGDTAIAINPKDHRFSNLVGQYVMIPFLRRVIPIISDKYADLQKGTGCVKITPAHDFNDYKVGYRHKLPMINIFTLNGKIKSQCDVYNYQGERSNIYDSFIPLELHHLDILSARIEIVKKIKKMGYLEKIETCTILVPHSERSRAIIIPMLTNQWYLKMSQLANLAIQAVHTKKIQFLPKQYENMYFSWMKNIEDWCISRQLWWGHRIPIWYDNRKNIYVGKNEKEIREKYNIANNIVLFQDEDVLDTWFSSGLWTFSTLGWPKKNKLLTIFHPTNVLISGFDIIFFWIARMIMLTMYFIKDKNGIPEVPFKKIYITGLIRDEHGKKMSKSKGNVIDPLDMIDGISLKNLIKKRTRHLMISNISDKIRLSTIKQFPIGIEATGTDALRFTFAALASNTRNINWDMNRLKGYRNFCNKLWNASRFVLMNTIDHNFSSIIQTKELSLLNKWILSKFNTTVKLYRESLDNYRFDLAANILYDFTWNIFCDWYLEFVKIVFTCSTSIEIYMTKNTLVHILELLLRLAHPIIPFITEEIWQRIKKIKKIEKDTIMLQPFPEYKDNIKDQNILQHVSWMQQIIIYLRNIRKTLQISKITLIPLFLYNIDSEKRNIIKQYSLFLKKIAFLKSITIISKLNSDLLTIKKNIGGIDIIIPLLEVVDKKKELKRLKIEKEKTMVSIQKIEHKLLNKNFLVYAPKNVVEKEKNTLIQLKFIHDNLADQINIFLNLIDTQ